MPIYTFQCPNCEIDEDVMLSMQHRHITRFHICGCEMKRLMAIPQPPIMRLSTKEKVSGGINNNDWMKPSYKNLAMDGFNRQKEIF